jgi:Na+/H+-dicarboxylate symporter
MARSGVNVLGNCLATVVIAKWEEERDWDNEERLGPKREAKVKA